MFFPLKLPQHRIKEFTHYEFFFKNTKLKYVEAYFHESDDFPIGMHSHEFYEINIITRGCGVHYIEKSSFLTEKGDVFVIPPGFKHGYWQDKDLRIFHILLSPVFLQHYVRDLNCYPGFSTLFEIEPYLRSDLNKEIFLKLSSVQFDEVEDSFKILANLSRSTYKGAGVQSNTLALFIIGKLCEYISLNHMGSPHLRPNSNTISIVNTLVYMKEHFDTKITVDGLAESARMSRTTYLRQFKEICNCTPTEYLLNCRLDAAASLLRNTNHAVIDIALECGFFDSSHFSRFFHKRFNLNPKDYRKHNTPATQNE